MSPRTVSVGFTLPQRGVLFGATTVEELLTLARAVDADPQFDSLWVGDSLLAKPRPDSIARLAPLPRPPDGSRSASAAWRAFPCAIR